jgi:hypothetical protein
MSGSQYASNVTDEQWSIVEPLLPKANRLGRRRRISLRAVLDAIFYLLRTGCQWRLEQRLELRHLSGDCDDLATSSGQGKVRGASEKHENAFRRPLVAVGRCRLEEEAAPEMAGDDARRCHFLGCGDGAL